MKTKKKSDGGKGKEMKGKWRREEGDKRMGREGIARICGF